MDESIKELKDTLEPYLKIISKGLIDQLMDQQIIEVKSDGDGKSYQLSKKTLELRRAANPPSSEVALMKNELLVFIEILDRVYGTFSQQEATLSEKWTFFKKKGIFADEVDAAPIFQVILNNLEILTTDKLDPAIREFLEASVLTIPVLKIQLLEYFVDTEFKKAYQNLTFEEPIGEEIKRNFPLLGRNTFQGDPDVIVDVKFRNRPIDTISEDIGKSHERLEQYDLRSSKNNFLILVLFSDQGERNDPRTVNEFEALLKSRMPNYADRIGLVLIPIKEINLTFESLLNLKSQVSNLVANFRGTPLQQFILDNQTGQMEIDQIFDLNTYYYEITFQPIALLSEWKIGIKFSRDDNFPDIWKDIIGYPVVYLHQQFQAQPLNMSFFNTESIKEYDRTLVHDYRQRVLTILISEDENSAKVSVLDTERRDLAEPQLIRKFMKFKIFAKTESKGIFKVRLDVLQRRKRS